MTETEIVSYREFARRVDISEASVRNAVKRGWIVQGVVTRDSGRPALDYQVALNEWTASPAGAQAARKNTSPKSAYIPKIPKSPAGKLEKEDTASRTSRMNVVDPELMRAKKDMLDNQTAMSKLDLQLKAIETQRKLGKLVDKETVYKELFEFGKVLREALTAIPDRIIDDILAAPDRASSHSILDQAIRTTLETITTPPEFQ